MLRIVKFPSTTAVFPFGKEPNALRHVIVGSGRPVWHGKITFSPTSATVDGVFWVIKAATVDLWTNVHAVSQRKKYERKQKILGRDVRISMIRVEHIIYRWHDLSLVLAQLRFYLVHWRWNCSSPSVACESLHNPRLAVDSRINNWSWGIFKPGRLFSNELYWITSPQRWFEQIVLLCSIFNIVW